jgi:tRNA U34 5-carboxymethylaminomethyl modifying enzyme MnmG/GidA
VFFCIRFRRDGGMPIPPSIVYSLSTLPALSNEEIEKLRKYEPSNLHEAGRIAGMTPAGLIYLHSYVRKINTANNIKSAANESLHKL